MKKIILGLVLMLLFVSHASYGYDNEPPVKCVRGWTQVSCDEFSMFNETYCSCSAWTYYYQVGPGNGFCPDRYHHETIKCNGHCRAHPPTIYNVCIENDDKELNALNSAMQDIL